MIIEIIKNAGQSIWKRKRRIDKLLDRLEYIQDRMSGIESFSDRFTQFDKRLSVMENSIEMIKSFFNIQERRKVNKLVKKERRKNAKIQ